MGLVTFPADNNRLGYVSLIVTNTLAYNDKELIMAVKVQRQIL
jgi:hypothetical protein